MEINDKIGVIYVADELTSQNSCLDVMMSDLIKLPNCHKITELQDQNWVRVLLKKQKVQKLTKGKLNCILKNHYELDRALKEACVKNNTVYVVFLNTSLINARYPASLLEQYRKQYGNVKYILFFIDTAERPICNDAVRLLKSGVMDAVYSFDRKDSEQYGMKHWHSPYSKILFDDQEKEYALYLCCSVGFRRNEILQVAEACAVNGVERYFHLRCSDLQTAALLRDIDNGIKIYDDIWLPYEQVLRESLAANCILEIVRPEQLGLTLRAYEAVCYNRKLLTNNKAILDFEFYNPRFMQYFEKVEDIDWDWVKEETEVDYHYNGEFSPLRLLEDIIASCEEK